MKKRSQTIHYQDFNISKNVFTIKFEIALFLLILISELNSSVALCFNGTVKITFKK